MKYTSTLIFIALFLVLGSGCQEHSSEIRIVIPGGYEGPIWIIQDESASQIQQAGGKYRVIIPTNGVVRVNSLTPFERWHKLYSTYDDGGSLPDCTDMNEGSKHGIIALRGGHGGTLYWHDRQYRYVVFFVGTESQSRAFLGKVRMPPEFDGRLSK